ncbi:MAG: SH3 domain-containing protein [Lachnospiraceae bacterium]|nr:SH3 domain-containing protein [Lachnospiraceae bacterium]
MENYTSHAHRGGRRGSRILAAKRLKADQIASTDPAKRERILRNRQAFLRDDRSKRSSNTAKKRLLACLTAGTLAFSCIITLPSALAQAKSTILFTTDGVNVRKSASASSKIKTAVIAGTPVTKLGQKGNWIKVTVDGSKGYIYKDLLTTEAAATDTEAPAEAQTTAAEAPTEAQTTAPEAPAEAQTTAVEAPAEAQTTAVEAPIADSVADTENYTLKVSSVSEARSAVIGAANNHLAEYYSQEKRDEEGYDDCSSLIHKAFYEGTGMDVGATTVDQMDRMASYLTPVKDLDNVTPGDVLYHVGSEGNHAGIYLGDGLVIHASQSKGQVYISSFETRGGYWTYSCNACQYVMDIAQ